MPQCPNCNGPMWDNRPKKAAGEFSPKSPDFKCKDKTCSGVVWPEKNGRPKPGDSIPISEPKAVKSEAETGNGKIESYAKHAGHIFAKAWEESKTIMALIPSKDGEELSAFEWLDLRVRITQNIAIEVNKIIRKERF